MHLPAMCAYILVEIMQILTDLDDYFYSRVFVQKLLHVFAEDKS